MLFQNAPLGPNGEVGQGYALNDIGQCIDIDECNDSSEPACPRVEPIEINSEL